jgi:predicted MPP superfamily phosphohydrolase
MELAPAIVVEATSSLIVVHVSDLHVRDGNSVALSRLRQLAGAIGSLRNESGNVLLLIGGDIAFSGKDAQYAAVIDALSDLEASLRKDWKFSDVRIHVVPGNHDCDFAIIPTGVQEALLSGLTGDECKQLEIVNTLQTQQASFDSFSGAVSPPFEKAGSILNKASITIGGKTVAVLMLNTAWSSRLHEKPGSLRMPAEVLPQIDVTEQLSIALLHHPLNWYSPQDGKALSDWLDANADIALWGHEHRSDDFRVTRKKYGSSVQHFLGLPIEDETDQCGFRCLVWRDDDSFEVSSYEWIGTSNPTLTEKEAVPRPSNPARSLGTVRFTKAFKAFLLDVGAAFTHTRLDRDLTLSDIFIAPEFKGFDADRTELEKLEASTGLEKMVDGLYGANDHIVYGSEQAGKTTFAKYAVEDARHRGITPVYLDASKLKSSNRGEITAWIRDAIKFQYELDCIPFVEQLAPAKKIMVVDNLHQAPGGTAGLRNITERLALVAAHKLLLTSHNPAIAILATNYESSEYVKIWQGADWFEILPMNNQRRGELIRRWASLGRDTQSDSELVESEVRQLKTALDRAFGRSFMPKYPFFLLVVLQQIESTKESSALITNGSHGHIFEALITKALEAALSCHGIDVAHDFLAQLAFEFWTAAEEKVSTNGFRSIIEEIRRTKLVAIEHPGLLKDLVTAKVLVDESGLISFRYQYLYYYYVARWLSSNKESEAASSVLDELVNRVHTEKASNVLMFVAHLGNEAWVLSKLLPAAADIFRGKSECVLIDRAPLAARFSEGKPETTLLVGDPQSVSDHYHGEQDRVEDEHANELVEDAFKFNTSLRMIQTLGQILRSRSGVDADVKLAISAEIVSLSKRLMTVIYDIAEESAESLIEHAADIFDSDLKLNSMQAAHLANLLLGAIVGGVAKSIVGRTADALASRELLPLIERLEAAALQKDPVDRDSLLVLLVSRVSAEQDYPKERVEVFLKSMKDADVLSRAALAHAVSRRFYLQPPPHAVRDSACARLGIQVKQVTVRKFPGEGSPGWRHEK